MNICSQFADSGHSVTFSKIDAEVKRQTNEGLALELDYGPALWHMPLIPPTTWAAEASGSL